MVVVSEVVDRNSHEGIFFTNFVKNIHAALAVIAFAYVVFLGFLNFSLYFCCHSFSWVSGGSIKPACRLPLLVYTITPSSVLRS